MGAVRRRGGMMGTRVFALLAFVTTLALGGGAMLAQTVRPGATLQLWEYHTEVVRERGVPPVAGRSARARHSL